MSKMQGAVASQTESVKATELRFEGIADKIDLIKSIILELNQSTQLMANNKNKIIDLTQNLSAISEENAAGTEEASASIDQQTSAISEIALAGRELALVSSELKSLIDQFKI